MAKRIKKILTIDELYMFCQSQNFTRFSSKDTGYQLAVQVPTTFEVINDIDENHRGMMKLKFKLFHDGINRNNSKVPRASAERAMNTISDRPILAAIHQLDNGEWDFEGHEMELVENDEGKLEINYIEKQVGSFSSEPPFWEHDDVNNKDFVCAYGYIPREYTKACEIIERKNGTKNSVELSLEEISFDTKDKCLVLEEFYVNASTLLGSWDDGTEIEEGMLGSRADIAEFSKDVNSVVFSSEEKIIALLEKIDKKLSSDVNIKTKEGGNQVNKFNELLAQYGKTVEDIDFEYEGLSDEELEAKFAEVFADGDNETPSGEENSSENPDDGSANGEGEKSDDNTDENSDDKADNESDDKKDEAPKTRGGDKKGGDSNDSNDEDEDSISLGQKDDDDTTTGKAKIKMSEFALSLQDKIRALSSLVSVTYEEADNEWYTTLVYEDYVVMVGWFNGRNYKQKYKEEDGEFTLVGDREQVYVQYLTQSEMDELDNMRKEFSVLKEFKIQAEKTEFEQQQKALLEDERFSIIAETEAYKTLVDEAQNYSLEELENKLKLIVADFALDSANFSKVNTQKSGLMFGNPNRRNPIETNYGGIFEEKNN